MTEFARWQWDDMGTWRDFAEQYQAEMEAAYQRRELALELEIPPFGTFLMNLEAMTQVTLMGRNPGYERDIRRQAKRIEIGYFLKGYDGEIFASDSALDLIEEEPVLDALLTVLSRIYESPSVDLLEDPVGYLVGGNEEAMELLADHGFDLISEGDRHFLVFMQDPAGLEDFKREVEARLARLRRPTLASTSSTASSSENPVVESPEEVQTPPAPPENDVQPEDVLMLEIAYREDDGEDKLEHLGIDFDVGLDELLKAVKALTGFRLPQLRLEVQDWEDSSEAEAEEAAADASQDGKGKGRKGLAQGLASLIRRRLQSQAPDAEAASPRELRNAAPPPPREPFASWRPLVAAIEPGVYISPGIPRGTRIVVEDFEEIFAERLQSGRLRLRDLAVVAPLLNWERQELQKLLLGRMRSLLEGSCGPWCSAANCKPSDELLCGRAILLWLYSDAPLDRRLEICKQMLPTEKRGRGAVLQVDRQDFLPGALRHLSKLEPNELRQPLRVRFVGEVAEDHGGPRRDFFGLFGSRLPTELSRLWCRLPLGALAPTDLPGDQHSLSEETEVMYRASGRACGLAIKHGDALGEEFAESFVHQVARGDDVQLEDLQRQLRLAEGEDDVRGKPSTLTRSLEELGWTDQTFTTLDGIELVPGGCDIPVVEANKANWIKLQLLVKLYRPVQKAAEAFQKGLLDIFGGSQRTCPLFVLLSPSELVGLWAGCSVSEECVLRWKEVSLVRGDVQQQADWFWRLLLESDSDFRGQVLKFTTGAHRLGKSGLQSFEIQPADGGDEALPRAMTCANMLQLPRYSSKDVLAAKLRKACECEGFQII